MPGRVRDLERASSCLDLLASFEGCQVVPRHSGKLAPQLLHAVTVDAGRAFNQATRIGHVRGASLVYEDLDMRMSAHDGAGGTRMIEVDVRQKNVTNIRPADTE